METDASSILIRKFLAYGSLSAAERKLLDEMVVHARDAGPDQDLVREGDRPQHCIILLEGFACRYRTLSDGRRQILSFHIPGDFLDLQGFLLEQIDHGIATLTPSRIATIPYTVISAMIEHPTLTRLFWRETLVDGAIFREWIVNVGRRTAYQRVAHVLCELCTRLQAVGLARDGVYNLPITQGELADATGLSTVHVNRVIQELRRDELIALRGRTFAALNWERLKSAAGFDPGYLQLPPNTAEAA